MYLIGNTFPRGLLLVLLLVILFIIGTAIWIFFQCRRHYPERDVYGAIATSKYNKYLCWIYSLLCVINSGYEYKCIGANTGSETRLN